MKTKLTKQQLDKILDLYNQDFGSRKIAEIIGVNRSTIQRAYKQLNLNSASKKTPRFAFKQTNKRCKICNIIKDISQFRKREKNGRISYECYCLDCEYFKNEERLKIRAKKLRQIDINFVLRRSISYFIWKALLINKSSKYGSSCINYLEYTIEELKSNLESKFENWMNWDNYGVYNKETWDDNDQITWTWNIDHIIPQSLLPYGSMEDENFKKCWSLNNLRPYSAKENNIDGANKIRHKSILNKKL